MTTQQTFTFYYLAELQKTSRLTVITAFSRILLLLVTQFSFLAHIFMSK